MVSGGGGGLAARAALAVWAVAAAVAAAAAGGGGGELVFRVPEVRVRHEAAPDRPVGSVGGGARRNALAATERQVGRLNVFIAYEEQDVLLDVSESTKLERNYAVIHAVSTPDARAAAKQIDMAELTGRWGCGECTREEIAYCDWQMMADHCCCDFDFEEPFPYIPHTCYFGNEPCRPIAKDCAMVVRLRDCCCGFRLAEKWAGIMSSSPKMSSTQLWLLALAAAVAAILAKHFTSL